MSAVGAVLCIKGRHGNRIKQHFEQNEGKTLTKVLDREFDIAAGDESDTHEG